MRQFVFMLINTLEGHCGLMEDSVLMSRSDTLTASIRKENIFVIHNQIKENPGKHIKRGLQNEQH